MMLQAWQTMRASPPANLTTSPATNYIDPGTRGDSLLALNVASSAVATVVIILRLYTRLFIKRWFGWDDVFIVCAYACTIAVNLTVDLGIAKFGWIRHVYDVPLSWIPNLLKLAWCTKLSFVLASLFTSLSLMTSYYRLTTESGQAGIKIALNVTSVFSICCWLPILIVQICSCWPIQEHCTHPQSSAAVCTSEGPFTFASSMVKTLLDFLITTLPILLILRMRLQRRQKWGVAILLAFGYLVTAAGALRTYFVWESLFASSKEVWSWWPEYPASLAAAVENDLAVTCACIPAIRPLWSVIFDGPVGSKTRSWNSLIKSSDTTTESAHNSTILSAGSNPSPTMSSMDDFAGQKCGLAVQSGFQRYQSPDLNDPAAEKLDLELNSGNAVMYRAQRTEMP